MEYIPKPVEELTFTDDFMFGTVMKIKYKNLRPAGAVPQAATGASEEAERERAAEGGIFRYVSSEKINN